MGEKNIEISRSILAYITNDDVSKLVKKVVDDTNEIDLIENLKGDRSFERVLANSPDLILLQISKSIKKEIDFIEEELKIYRKFSDILHGTILRIERSTKYYDDMENIQIKIKELYKKIMLEEHIPHIRK